MNIVEDNVVLKTLDESPRFRSDLIKQKIEKSNDLVTAIIDQYELKLVHDIYQQGVNIESYNSKKRAKLKKQELILIKKICIYDVLGKHMRHIIDEVVEIDLCFTEQFNDNFHQTVDHDFVYQQFFQFIDSYFEEYAIRSNN